MSRKAALEASIEEADGNAAFVAQALGGIARAQGPTRVASRCRAQGETRA
ncbi:MAG: hypothetical protein OXQ28_07985 [Acidobacteriota bacterium]|nr:hypothetical protein [Acidobacteriota bacterium]